MPGTSTAKRRTAGPLDGIDALVDAAEPIAAAWAARASGSTTVGIERAILRLFGVGGLSRAGVPLAGAVVERYAGGQPERLGAGLALAFAMALLEYDLSPQQLALDVAAGTVDLALEADLLRREDRRGAAEVEATALAGAALAQIDADRTARRELIGMLGDAVRPWIGTTLTEPVVGDATAEARRLVGAGFDLVRVDVPVGRELTMALAEAGREAPAWRPRDEPPGDPLAPRSPTAADQRPPTGSQRGLARLRLALDSAAAGRQAYVRLATAVPALAAPEAAVVAAFERVDLVGLDVMTEIVGGIDPDRALADHAFALRLLRRAGADLLFGAGPLVVGPDIVAGVPSDPATRSGRALALQLLAVRHALELGLEPSQVLVGAVPAWLIDEPDAAPRALAEVELRRALFPDHRLAFEEPIRDAGPAHAWPHIVGGILPRSGAAGLVVRRPEPGGGVRFARSSRAAADVGVALADARGPTVLDGVAASHARDSIAAAAAALERLAGRGWRAVLGEPPGDLGEARIGATSVVERTDPFDPFATA